MDKGPKIKVNGQAGPFEDVFLLNARGIKKLQRKYAKFAHPKRFNWDWSAIRYNRVALMTHLASKIGPECRYLEIGCAHNELFDAMPITHKIGVDPAIGGTHKMTSEAFFADFPDERFDLIFIDGLHTYEQVRADLVNALRVLRPGGYIGLHDMLPKEWGEAFVPRIQGEWTGDVWKVAHEIAVTEGLDFRVFHMDAGVGLVRVPGDPNVQLADMQAELIPAQYDYFCAHLDRVKQVTWDEGMEWLSGQEG